MSRGDVLYVWSSHVARVIRINRVRFSIPARGQLNRDFFFFLSPFAPENLVSRDGFGSPIPRQPAHSSYSG